MNVVWQSLITDEMVSNLDEDTILELCEELDNVVSTIIQEFIS
jgi:hypothetical protein